ncbi:Tim44/TimA family putative adaptor protein [Sphingosinicella rhizophila]|uniref:Tim44/TimA family putative adaptor protein n=1 Tax=Sphingosinicella rhizophila TaxID=3050082 RepID=A0ABU3Q9A7_9SPHN|nr:Tim44/TimA family putative adaptor protein [Sphingosinicella sp. GR2756]MDT9599991.1 Tim44/TimA family putative adaptor protein [Sphingosinicella sp. GR2756]
MTVEIVLLAMVALFVGLRLYAVLGRRTGHEQQPVVRAAETVPLAEASATPAEASVERAEAAGLLYEEGAARGIRAIVAADPGFDVGRFLDGAQAAYRMILEAFWKGDEQELMHLVGDDVRSSFVESIKAREAAGQKLDNRLVRIDRALIHDAELDGRIASISVRFEADIVALTRNEAGEVIAGSVSDAVPTNDLWTFRRTLGSDDPNWMLVETDEAA